MTNARFDIPAGVGGKKPSNFGTRLVMDFCRSAHIGKKRLLRLRAELVQKFTGVKFPLLASWNEFFAPQVYHGLEQYICTCFSFE